MSLYLDASVLAIAQQWRVRWALPALRNPHLTPALSSRSNLLPIQSVRTPQGAEREVDLPSLLFGRIIRGIRHARRARRRRARRVARGR